MSTHSRIGIEQEDGSVKSIYCHWDGHVETNGKCLMEHYSDPVKAAELIELGSISQLHPKLSTDQPHSFSKPEDGVTVAYHRDRGEAKVIDKNTKVTRYFDTSEEEYVYMLTQEGEWVCKVPDWPGVATVSDVLSARLAWLEQARK